MKLQGTGVYLRRGDEILFLVRNKKNDKVHKQGLYLPIGGKIERGESAEACAIREVAEESGVRIKSLELRGVHYIRQTDQNLPGDWINFIYTSDDFEGEPQAGSEGHFEWAPLNKLPAENMYGGDVIYIGYLNDYKFHVAEFLYDGFNFVDVKLLHTA